MNQHVLIYDIETNKIYGVNSDDTRPFCFRINYSAVLYEFKILIFGGLDHNL